MQLPLQFTGEIKKMGLRHTACGPSAVVVCAEEGERDAASFTLTYFRLQISAKLTQYTLYNIAANESWLIFRQNIAMVLYSK